jgi:osmotically-inducible protein OsmY
MRILLVFGLIFLLGACSSVMDATSDGPIKQNPTTRTFGSLIDDENIENVTIVNIKKINPRMRNAHFNVVSYNGVVLLVGQVPDEELRVQAATAASNVKRVRQVQNALTVEANTSAAVRSYDSWLTTKIKGAFALDNDINGARIKVITENGVVYLMGLVRQSQADRATAAAQQIQGTQRIVKAFEYID